MVKHIFFIGSFGSIYRRALPLIDGKSKEGDVLVVTSNENAYKFFTKYTPFNTIKTSVHPNLVQKHKTLLNIIMSKFEYRRLFKQYKDCNIYFFNTNNTIVTFSYLQKLAKHNQLYFYSSEPDKLERQIKPTIINSWVCSLIEVIVKAALGIDIKCRSDSGKLSLCIYKEFFKKNDVIDRYEEFNPTIYKKYMKKVDLGNKKILVLWSDLVGEGRVFEQKFTMQCNQLIDVLDKLYPNQYIVKAHPNMSALYGKMINVPQLDSYVPSQFFMYHPWKAVIADCSAALVFPEEQNLNNTKLIEMVDVIEFKQSRTKRDLKAFLIKWNPKLLFPQSFGELEEMIK